MSRLRIGFAGTPEFGIPCLEALARSEHQIVAIYTQPDRPAGRGRHLHPSAVKVWAKSHKIPVYQPLNFKDENSIHDLRALELDVMVVIAYGLILPASVLSLPRYGCINVHASLLPAWRGASPIQHAILHGDMETGVTIMQMDQGMDTGDCLEWVKTPIHSNDTSASLHDRLAQLACEPLLSTLNNLISGKIHRQKQASDLASYAPKIKKEDAAIDWQQPAKYIHQKIRAFIPWPIAYTQLNEHIIRIHQAEVVPQTTNESPGHILTLDKSGMLVSTGFQGLRIKSIQLAGGRAIPVGDYLNANQLNLKVGMVLK